MTHKSLARLLPWEGLTMTGTKFAKLFTTKTREPDGELFTTLRDDAPEWLKDAVCEAHQGKLPCDWVFDECLAACEAFDEGDIGDDGETHEHIDARVDTGTYQLFKWANEFCVSDIFSDAEERAREYGEADSVVTMLQRIQFCAIEAIVGTVLQACQEEAARLESESECVEVSDASARD